MLLCPCLKRLLDPKVGRGESVMFESPDVNHYKALGAGLAPALRVDQSPRVLERTVLQA
jgi:hypothetical protein